MPPQADSITVLHSVAGAWLPTTQAWLHHSIANLAPSIESHISCRWRENRDAFDMPRVHALAEASLSHRIRNAIAAKLGTKPYHGHLVAVGQRIGAHIVHSHFAPHGWEICEAVRKIGARHIVNFYGYDVDKLPRDPVWQERYARLFEQVDRVLCEGPHMRRRIVALGCPGEKALVHHLGVPVSRLEFRPRKWSPPAPLRVLIAASFCEKKGIPYAIEALGRIPKSVSLELTLIGEAAYAEHQPERQRIFAALDRTGMRDRARLLGFQPYHVLMKEAYEHHLFLSPSVTAADGDTEGGAPIGLLEMAATGMPIVSTRHCDIPGVILDGTTGLLAGERDVPGLTDCLMRLIERPQDWGGMLDAGRRHVETAFNAARQGQLLSEVYRTVVDRRPARSDRDALARPKCDDKAAWAASIPEQA